MQTYLKISMETKDFILLGKMMREIFRVLKKRFDEISENDIKISIEQYSLLRAISIKEEDVIQKDMAEILGKDKSAILRSIDSLEEKELIRRVADNKDRRKNYLMVTKTGTRVLQRYSRIVNELMYEIQLGLNKSDQEAFFKVVNHIVVKIKE